MALEFVERLRPTERYDSIEALLEQMAEDVERCRTVLSSIVPSEPRRAVPGNFPVRSQPVRSPRVRLRG